MALVIGGVLALLAVAVAVYPFIRHRFAGASGTTVTEDEDDPTGVGSLLAADELTEIYRAINTLRLERELGNIPEGLYREQLNGYRLRAAQALRERELNQAEGEDWALEEEIKVARSGFYRIGGADLPCNSCGKPAVAGADDCPECGVPVHRPASGAASPTDSEERDQ